jgi:hypothetical protein
MLSFGTSLLIYLGLLVAGLIGAVVVFLVARRRAGPLWRSILRIAAVGLAGWMLWLVIDLLTYRRDIRDAVPWVTAAIALAMGIRDAWLARAAARAGGGAP